MENNKYNEKTKKVVVFFTQFLSYFGKVFVFLIRFGKVNDWRRNFANEIKFFCIFTKNVPFSQCFGKDIFQQQKYVCSILNTSNTFTKFFLQYFFNCNYDIEDLLHYVM